MRFSRLKLTGFKSFVDATELHIEPGLTGIVGPNGCGKSNIVEALRWAMGEVSAKQLRGGDMYDVIFAGTADRVARNTAVVTITLDNNQRTAPAPFNDEDEIVVSRRIERDKGSVYRINGRDVRARDIQLLFADAATGARSPALVSQGEIGTLINAKPSERRVILENAAGISGLHVRRHEAQLKLRQAETNLERLDDILNTMESQMNSLLRQARQARRYGDLSHEISKLRALRHHVHWLKACADLASAESQVNVIQVRVGEAAEKATAADTARAHTASELLPMRQTDAELGAVLQRLQLERNHIAQEGQRAQEQRDAASERVNQFKADMRREQNLVQDAEKMLKRLYGERDDLLAPKDTTASVEQTANQDHMTTLRTQLHASEAVLESKMSALVSAETRLNAIKRETQDVEQRLATAQSARNQSSVRLQSLPAPDTDQLATLATKVEQAVKSVKHAAEAEQTAVTERELIRQAAQANIVAASDASDAARSENTRRAAEAHDAVERAHRLVRDKVEAKRSQLDFNRATLRAALDRARSDMDAASTTQREAAQALSTITAETEALERILAQSSDKRDDTDDPLIKFLQVESGFELALGVALGDDLMAPVGGDVAYGWSFFNRAAASYAPADFNELRPTLESVVKTNSITSALIARLKLVAIAPDEVTGHHWAAALIPGQRVVTRDGHLWRWDGFHNAPNAGQVAVEVLKQRRRLSELEAERHAAEDLVSETEKNLNNAEAALVDANAALQTADQALEADLKVFEDHAAQAAQVAKVAWERVRVENAAREREADMAVRLAREEAEQREQESRNALGALKSVLAQAQSAEGDARAMHQKAVEQSAAVASEYAALKESITNANRDVNVHSQRLAELQEERVDIPEPAELTNALSAARLAVNQARADLAEQDAIIMRAATDAAAREARLAVVGRDVTDWQQRFENGTNQLKILKRRLEQQTSSLIALDDKPARVESQLAALDHKLAQVSEQRQRSARALTEKEEYAAGLERDAAALQDTLQSMREAYIRAEAGIDHARAHLANVLQRIEEDMAVAPEQLAGQAQITDHSHTAADLPSIEQTETDLDHLRRQRDAIGPVNLRAELELRDIKQEFSGLRDEKQDLVGAIGRLSKAIDEINAEGRSRLLDAFDRVNANFDDLFKRLFGGGSACLTLIEHEDPLAAGLEVMASPPGKRLQTMSLLSGGEQALTAISLLFAVFMVNPAPICVLDEVDAPLDDANVERFCNLLDQMVKYEPGNLETRFLLVSHHPLTMARMNRLFGVTMSERGVSSLVSLDLERAAKLKATA